MTRALHLAPGLTLPIDAVTETFAILAKRGVGKSYTGMKLAEEMAGAGAQIVVLDPLDAWWGLRSSADGKGDGLKIYQFGGQREDLPLEAGSGELLADVVVDHDVSVILSLRHLSKTKQRGFVADFAERLYHRKGEPAHRTPLHVFIDEADAFVPQRVMGDAARMVGAIDDIVRRGRNAGLGSTLISQRAAVVNWDVLSQCEVLVALRTISQLDRKALENWIEAHDAHDQRATFMASLATLGIGEAWVWSPGWLEIFERVQIGQRWTFDSSATPKAGARPSTPAKRAEVDLEQLGERILATRDKAKADDPKRLREQIRDLQEANRKWEDIAKRAQAETTTEIVERIIHVDRPVVTPEARGFLEGLHRQLQTTAEALLGVANELSVAAHPKEPERKTEVVRGIGREAGDVDVKVTPIGRGLVPERQGASSNNGSGDQLTKGERAFLGILAQYPQGRSKSQLAMLAGYSPKSGGNDQILAALRRRGAVDGGVGLLKITGQGVGIIGDDYEPLPTGEELRRYWIDRLSKGESTFLRLLTEAYPRSMSKAELAEAAGYSPKSGGNDQILAGLRKKELITGSVSALTASEELFGS